MISVIHPSRGRADKALATCKSWLDKADKKVEYLIAVDCDDKDLYRYEILLHWGLFEGVHKSAIEAINNAAKLATGDILIVISDDFDCPDHWDTLLLDAIAGRTDFCAKTQDGHQDWLITLPIMDRIYYERFGYVYHPEYQHMFADLEMTSVAWMLDRYIELPIEFKHNHYSLTGQKPDAINRKNNATWGQGQMLFRQRKAMKFGIEPIKELPDLKQHFI